MTTIVFSIVAVLALATLLFAPFTRGQLWRATVTPLASIIGSGFLVSAPLLAREFGGYAALAMALLIMLAALIGWTIRYNITVVENELAHGTDRALMSIEKLSHVVLAFAYFISVAYYLFLLGHFVVAAFNIDSASMPQIIAITLLAAIGILGWSGGVAKITQIERYTSALNLAVIIGFLAALAAYGVDLFVQDQPVLPPPGRFELSSLPVLLGLLIVVQGFETTRFTGDNFDQVTRARAMWIAQLVSGVIYVAFFVLLSPLLTELSLGTGVAAIITLSTVVAAILPLSLTVAAAASQFSASVADSLGDAGLIEQITEGKVNPSHAYPLIAAVGIAILITIDVNSVIALASRAFALFYALQCLVAWESVRKKVGETFKTVAFMVLALISFAVFIFGVPAG
ncbi:MAG: hypothetical protein LJE67_15050 [Salaquimonas sp.]|nr:hypothetical protein [Salaquimonas sp.]